MNNTGFLNSLGTFMTHTIDGMTPKTLKECISSNFDRDENEGFHRTGSLGGRIICAILIPAHLVGIAYKPIFQGLCAVSYTLEGCAAAVCAVAKAIFTLTPPNWNNAKLCFAQAGILAVSVILAPAGQVIRVARAALGIIHPGAYFKACETHRFPANNAIHYLRQGQFLYNCSRDHLKNDPCAELNAFATWNNAPKSIRITFNAENGSDAGGLKREFISTLFENVSAELKMSEGVIFANNNNEGTLKNIGKVLNFLLFPIDATESITETPIGEVFDERYYKGILAFSYEDLQKEWKALDNAAKLAIIETLFINKQQKTDHEKVQSVCAKKLGDMPHIKKYFNKKDFNTIIEAATNSNHNDFDNYSFNTLTEEQLKEMQDWFLNDHVEGYNNQVKTLFLLAKEVSKGVPQWDWATLQQFGHKRIQDHLQGDFNRQRVLQAIHFHDLSRKKVPRIINFLKQRTDEELKLFLQTVTGSKVLAPNQSIQFVGQNYIDQKGSAYIAHTCSRLVEIKKGLSVEELEAALASMCAAGQEAFNLA